MSLRLIDGFDHWVPGGEGAAIPTSIDTTTSASSRTVGYVFWTGCSGDLSQVTGANGQGLKATGSGNSFIFVNMDGRSYWVVGVRFKQSSLYGGWPSAVIRIRECVAAKDIACVAVDASGYIKIYKGDMDILLATSAAALVATGNYYYLEFKYSNSVTPWLLEVRLDGVVVATASGSTTLTSLVANQIMFGINTNRIIDDVVIIDNQAASDANMPAVTDYVGPVNVELWLPSEDSETGAMTYVGGSPPATTTWGLSGWGINTETPPVSATPGNAFAAVLAATPPDGATNYIGSDAITLPLALKLSPPAWQVGTPVLAAVQFAVSENDGGTPSIEFGYNSGIEVSPFYGIADPAIESVGSSWQINFAPFVGFDNTGNAWTDTTLASSEWLILQEA